MSDEELVGCVACGDKQAFRTLVNRHGMRFRALAFRIVGDMSGAEDMVQEAFVKLWVHASNFKGEKAKFTTWFHRIVVNRCLDEMKKRRPFPLPDGYDEIDTAISADAKVAEDAAEDRLGYVLSCLSGRQRTAVILCYFDGLSNQEAATVMELNIKAYESLLQRARSKMRNILAAEKSDLLEAFV